VGGLLSKMLYDLSELYGTSLTIVRAVIDAEYGNVRNPFCSRRLAHLKSAIVTARSINKRIKLLLPLFSEARIPSGSPFIWETLSRRSCPAWPQSAIQWLGRWLQLESLTPLVDSLFIISIRVHG
jgi:hypothetical protein